MTLPEGHAHFTKASVKLLTFFESVQVILYQSDLISSITPNIKSNCEILKSMFVSAKKHYAVPCFVVKV